MKELIVLLMQPLNRYLSMENLMEINVTESGYLCLEKDITGFERQQDQNLDFIFWQRLCRVLANVNGVAFDPILQPRLSTVLPGGHRIEAMLGNNINRKISVSIRVNRKTKRKLNDFGLSECQQSELISLINKGCNCLISGGTSSGKTSFLNVLLQELVLKKRILTVEDVREICLPNIDYSSQYIVSRNEKNAVIGYPEIIDHLMRSRPDIIVVGEVSVHNAFPILKLLNSGHKGFFCTIHANSPRLALNAAFSQNIQLAGGDASNVGAWLCQTLDIVIQLCSTKKGKKVSQIYFPRKYNLDN